ncbi:DNase I-like protein, partial [Armillaria solidipes]
MTGQSRCRKGTKASIKIAALNIRGMGNINTWHPDNKWNHVNQIMNTKRIGILIVGEAHLNDERRNAIENMPRNRLRVLHSEDPVSPNARGVAIVLNKELTETENVTATEIIPGRALIVETCWHRNEKLSILGIYAPVNPVENARFWASINRFFEENPNIRKPDVMAGDMNITEDPIDRLPARHDYASAVDSLDEVRTSLQLIDGWRDCYPTTLKYTWRRPATGTQSRLDRIYIRSSMNEHCYEWTIEKSGVPTDHDMVSVRFSSATAPNIGHGRWVMPLHIVKDRKVKGFLLNAGRTLQEDVETYSKDEHRTPSKNPQILWENFNKEFYTLARQRAKVVIPQIDREI